MKSQNKETAICRVCKNPFEKRIKPRKSSKSLENPNIRSSAAVTCSSNCSRWYNATRQRTK